MKTSFNNKGFTLVELLIVLAIMGFITVGTSMTINTILSTFNVSRENNIAIRQVQNAGFWITKDIQRSNGDPVLTPPNGFPAILSCFTGTSSTSNETVTYSIQNGTMTRTITGGDSTMVAQYILNDDTTNISQLTDNRTKYIFNITSQYGSENATGQYMAEPRVQ